MKRILGLAALPVLLVALACDASAQPRKLNGPEITRLLAGHKLVNPPDKGQSVQAFDGNGMTTYQSADKQLQGRWKVVADRYCSVWDETSEPKCLDVYVDGPAVTFVGADGAKTQLLLAK